MKKFIATDLYDHQYKELEIVTNLPSEEAVKKFGEECDLLMLISPVPDNFMDYYAIKEFENFEKVDDKKYVLFFGELGASDGGPGMY